MGKQRSNPNIQYGVAISFGIHGIVQFIDPVLPQDIKGLCFGGAKGRSQ